MQFSVGKDEYIEHGNGKVPFIIDVISAFHSRYIIAGLAGWPRCTVSTFASKMSRLGLNPDPAINCHPSVSQAGPFINVCAVPRIDIKLDVPSAGISWWTLKIPLCPSQREGELSPAP